MTMWQPSLAAWPGPRYRALVDAMAAAVENGELPPGTRLPPQRDLAYRLGVTIGTVSRAYALAAERGLVSGEVGRGTFVRNAQPLPRRNTLVDGAGEPIKLTVNAPPDRSLQELFAGGLAALSHEGATLGDLLAYTPKPGLQAHRAAAAQWLQRLGVPADPACTLLTGGAQQGLVVALAGLLRPGEPVLVEALTYGGLLDVINRLGLAPHPLALDEEGLRPDALEAAASAGLARVLVVNPTIHNPTTATMSPARREALAAIARKHDLLIIEDEVYALLVDDPPPPLAALAPERVVHVTSASKSLAGGLRVGMVASPAAWFEAIATAQHDLFLIAPALQADLVSRWVVDGTAELIAGRQREEARRRQEIARAVLGNRHYRAAGFHLWLPLPPPWRSAEFVGVLQGRGVTVSPAFAFAADRLSAPHAVRIAISGASSHERLRHALQIVVQTLDESPGRRGDMI